MNALNEEQIESLLRASPRPTAPGDLKARLIREARSAPRTPAVQPTAPARSPGTWFIRWRPVLLPAAFSLVCAAVLAVQQVQLGNLKQEIQRLSAANTTENQTPTVSPDGGSRSPQTPNAVEAEIARLKELAASLDAEVSQLERLRNENQELRTKLAAPPSTFSAAEAQAAEVLQKARESALRIACVNNLKQLGLAVRIWASDNGDQTPLNIIDMTNEMNTPKILFCPADTAHEIAKTGFSSYNPASNLSYEYLAPGVKDRETSPFRVLFRCPIHNNVCLYDGSVQSVGTNTDLLFQRDGVLYYNYSRPR